MRNWDDDDSLAADLADALQAANDIPPQFLEAGKAAFAWRTIDADLAELTFDSAETASRGMRAGGAAYRSLTYAGREVTIGLEVTTDGLHGQVAPPQAGKLEVRQRDGSSLSVDVDEVGWFQIRPRPPGMFRLHLRTARGLFIVTEWMVL